MGQKVSPVGFRLALKKEWQSKWFTSKHNFGKLLLQDYKIRQFLSSKPSCQGVSRIEIRRLGGKIEVTVHTARPGAVIGKKGAEIELLKKELNRLTGQEVWFEVAEVKRPDLDATLSALGIARQLEHRISFRRALKKAVQSAMEAGALGVKIQVGGRLGGAEIARSEEQKAGSVPSQTIRANVDYASACAQTTYGKIGIKVWIHKNETFKAS